MNAVKKQVQELLTADHAAPGTSLRIATGTRRMGAAGCLILKEDNVNLKNTKSGELIASVETSDANAFVQKTQNGYTKQEVEDAKQILRIFGEGPEIFAVRTESGKSALKWAALAEGFGLKISQFYIGIEDSLFPSIYPGECAKIKDIANYTCNN